MPLEYNRDGTDCHHLEHLTTALADGLAAGRTADYLAFDVSDVIASQIKEAITAYHDHRQSSARV